jgi:hypothetical protein
VPTKPGPNLEHRVARGTIANILREHGLEPAPERVKKTTSPINPIATFKARGSMTQLSSDWLKE